VYLRAKLFQKQDKCKVGRENLRKTAHQSSWSPL